MIIGALRAILLPISCADAKTHGGDVVWQAEVGVVEISASDGRVAAIGTIPNPDGSRTSLVRVYDANKGALDAAALAPATLRPMRRLLESIAIFLCALGAYAILMP